jgi:hypothetical protein
MLYRVSTLKVEYRQLTLCIQFIDIMPLFRYINNTLLKDTQPHYIYKPESCLENDNYKLYFDRTVLTDIHIQHNRPDIIILNKQQKQAYLLDIAVPNSHNITQTYNTKINKYLELSVAMFRKNFDFTIYNFSNRNSTAITF